MRGKEHSDSFSGGVFHSHC